MKQNCKNCGYFNLYYIKEYDHFEETDCGVCNKKHQTVKKDINCEFWKANDIKKFARQRICLESLDAAVTSIQEIAQILKEQNKEQNGF